MPTNKKLEEFFKKRPGMLKKYEYPGTFRDFITDIRKSIVHKKNKQLMKKAIIEEVQRILPGEISLHSLESQLSRYPLISTADHHALLNDKLLYNSNILYAEIIKELKLPYAVVLATGSIPMKSKSHPRGFFFKNQKFNFFGEKQCKLPVFLFQDKLSSERRKGIDSFCISYDRDSLTPEEKKFLEFLFFDCLEIQKARENYEKFSDQITFLNHKLWKYYFDRSIRGSVPDLIYLQSNQVLLNLLIDEIKREDSLISLILFDPAVRRLFIKNFYGIPSCWGENMGSQLFWGIIERKNKIRVTGLQLDDASNSLVGENFNIKLEREVIIDALVTRKILSTLFLDFLITTFIEGSVALGGFNQVDYLPQIQKVHIKTLKELEMMDAADQFASRITDGLICGMFPFNFNSGIDLIWHYNSRDGRFNGNLDGGLTDGDLDKMLDMRVKDMIGSAIETMWEIV
ncbi:MAG: hypothetical protein JSV88_30650 [Candidatus Aminicenantes bacterium]|nr:MAG: hypothetical protein JSV88_30650 [Candidatus Aminicenantes bacterium]